MLFTINFKFYSMNRYLLFFSFVFLAFSAVATLPARIGSTFPSQSAYVMGTGEQLSGQQFQTDGILSYKGYQYTVYYNMTRNVTLARRKMPVGAWEEVVLPYRNTANDAHNTISIGISAGDGRIHLSYDHHNDPLHYSYSVVGSANEPEKMPWEAASFSATTDIMEKAIPNVTYPRFISKPDGNLLFECRFRWSGYGDSYLREYDYKTQKWSLIGRYVQGEDVDPDACAYINGMSYDKQGRLHVTWCWRDDFGGGSNHDFYYAYSEDHGRTWKDTKGDAKASVDVMDPVEDRVTRNALGQTKKSYMVEAIPYNRGYINQETQDVDSKGRIHAVNSHIPDGQASDANWNNSRVKARLHHRFRKEDGTWVKRMITVNGVSVNSTRRVHLAIDSYDNAYVMATGYGVLMASPADDYATWKLVSQDGRTGYLSEPLADKPLLREKGVLSFVYLSSTNKIEVFDFLARNPSTPTGTGLLAEYFANADFTGLIRKEVVASTLAGQIPTGTKSIRWSGAFETVEGEQHQLHLTTATATRVYVNDQLQTEIAAGSGEVAITYPLIASHKNNLVIESVGATAVSLMWSAPSVTKQNIPTTSLYLTKANDRPGSVTPPVLPVKAQLEEALLAKKKEINTSAKEIVALTPFNPQGDYSIDLRARVQAADGRGLDIEARAQDGKGFRFSLAPASTSLTSVLSASTEFTRADNVSTRNYRFAVSNDKVLVYSDQEYVGSTSLAMIGDIQADDTEVAAVPTYGPEAIGEWAGPDGAGAGKPTDYGWSATTTSIPWQTAGYPGGVRYEEVTHQLEAGGSFTGRLMTIRWDAGSYSSATYFYPLTLAANTSYELSFLYEYWSNASSAQTITVGISSAANAANRYHSQPFITSASAQRLRRGNFLFTSNEAGTYYLTFNGTYAMYGIGDFSLKSKAYENRLQLGKNYEGGQLTAEIESVSYEEGAFAPDILSSVPESGKTSSLRVSAGSGQLKLSNIPAGARLRIIDLTGRILLNTLAVDSEMSVPAEKGIYVVQLERNEKSGIESSKIANL